MNHYCLCCAHCHKGMTKYGRLRLECNLLYVNELCMSEILTDVLCDYYTPRPEPQFSQCVAVLKMLGVEVGQ